MKVALCSNPKAFKHWSQTPGRSTCRYALAYLSQNLPPQQSVWQHWSTEKSNSEHENKEKIFPFLFSLSDYVLILWTSNRDNGGTVRIIYSSKGTRDQVWRSKKTYCIHLNWSFNHWVQHTSQSFFNWCSAWGRFGRRVEHWLGLDPKIYHINVLNPHYMGPVA